MVGATYLLDARRSFLLPSLLHQKQRHWYKPLHDKDLYYCRISPLEFTDFVVRNLDTVASVSVIFFYL